MDASRRALVDRLWAEGREVDAALADRTERRRNLEPDSASLLHVLVRSLAPQRVLELGTSNGFSTIWIADALQATDGRLTTVDNDPGRAELASANLADAGLSGVVEQIVGDAGELLAAEGDASWPLVFLDAERSDYVGYWPDLRRVLAPGALLVVDNCISHADQVLGFRALVDADESCTSTLVPTGAGLLLVSVDR